MKFTKRLDVNSVLQKKLIVILTVVLVFFLSWQLIAEEKNELSLLAEKIGQVKNNNEGKTRATSVTSSNNLSELPSNENDKYFIRIWEYYGDERWDNDSKLPRHVSLGDLDSDKKTFILIHGNLDRPTSFSLRMANLIRNNTNIGKEAQILLIDWEDNSNHGESFGQLFEADNGDDVPMVVIDIQTMFREADKQLTNITIIGHSFGAHIGGNLAWNAQIGTVKHLVALDPASEKNDLGNKTTSATDWLNLRDTGTYVETYMSSSNYGNVTYTYGNDNFVVASLGLLSCNNFTHQKAIDGTGSIEGASDTYTANHSRAHEFYESTINALPSNFLGWGWVYNNGEEHYKNMGIKTRTKSWEGVILTSSSTNDEPVFECIDNNSTIKSENLSDFYKNKILSASFADLIYATCKMVDYTDIDAPGVKDEIFKEGEKTTINVSFANKLINYAYTSKAFTLGQLQQGASIKVWLAKTDDIEASNLGSNAILVGCKKLKYLNAPISDEDYIIQTGGSLDVVLDFSKIKASDYPDGAYLYVQVGAQSIGVMSEYLHKKYSDYNVSKDEYEPTDLSQEQAAWGYIDGEINIEKNDNLKIIPIKFEGSIDLCFLFDTTGSMQGVLDNCKNNAIRNLNAILEQVPGSRVSVAQYRDRGDSFVYRGVCGFTDDKGSLISGINGLNAYGGDDEPEAAYYSMIQCMNGNEIGSWRKNAKSKSIILFTDAPSNNYGGCTSADVIACAKNSNIFVTRSTYRGDDDDATPFTIYVVGPAKVASYYSDIIEATNGRAVTTYSSDEVSDAIIEIIEEIIENIGGSTAWYPTYTFKCEHDHKAHEVWVYDDETLVTKMVVNGTSVTAADYLKAGCPGLESGKEYTFKVYEWEGDECESESTLTPEYDKPSTGTITAEATDNANIYDLTVSIPAASKFNLTVTKDGAPYYPTTEVLFTDSTDNGSIVTSKTFPMEFVEAGVYTIEALGANLCGQADEAATCTITVEGAAVGQYTTWPDNGFYPGNGEVVLQAGANADLTFSWPSMMKADSYNLKVYDGNGKLIKSKTGITDSHATVRLSDDVYFWRVEAVTTTGETISSEGMDFSVTIKNEVPIIREILPTDGKATSIQIVCDKATSNYNHVSYDIQFYTVENGWLEFMGANALPVTFTDDDGDGIYSGELDLKANVSGAYILIRPRVKGKLMTEKQALYRLP